MFGRDPAPKRRFRQLGAALAMLVGGLGGGLLFAGCGAAYYGAVIGYLITQEDENTVDTSFPDGAPTAPVAPAFTTLELSSAQATLKRLTGGGFPLAGAPAGVTIVDATDFEILKFNFPPGFGEARSNRDAGINLTSGEKLAVRISGDVSKEITFDAADVSSVGSAVAARIQARVRALTPTNAGVPATAYSLFTATFNPNTASYVFKAGTPSETSAVVWQPEPVSGSGDVTLDATSAKTATRLGLGVANGGVELTGAESVRVTVVNRGDDVIPSGTKVNLYLSHDKVLDPVRDILFDTVGVPKTIAVGEARIVPRRNGNKLPERLLRSDITAGSYYVLWDLQAAGGEKVLTNNLATSLKTVEVYQPSDDPATTVTEAVNDLDFSVARTSTSISAITSVSFDASVIVTNLGKAVPAAGVIMDIDLVFSVNAVLDEPAAFVDPAGTVAGVRINPTDPSRPITITINDNSAVTAIAATVFGNTITVNYNRSATSVATVQSLIDVLNKSQGTLVDAFHDGKGTVATDTLNDLVTAAKTKTRTATDFFISTKQVTFAQTTGLMQERSFSLSSTIRNTFKTTSLPAKFNTLFRIRPRVGTGEAVDNTKNNVRQGQNYVRVFSRAKAFFDGTTGAILPTVAAEDFAALDAVTQRPVNTGSIRQGQQRVFSFQIPDTALTNDESQLLVILRTENFDARIDLLSGSGKFIAGSDDTALGSSPLVYTPAVGSGANRTFYVVVAPARADESDVSGGGESFNLTISVNSRQVADPGLVSASTADNVIAEVVSRYQQAAPVIQNNVLIPFSLANSKGEIMFVLPQRARVRFLSKPVFKVSTTTVITGFVSGRVPSPVSFQAQLEAGGARIVYRPAGGTIASFHTLEAGVYTVAFQGASNATDTQAFRFKVETQFIADEVK